VNIFAKFHENRTQHFSRNHELTNEPTNQQTQLITNERMKQTTNKQAQLITIPPHRSNNSQARREGGGGFHGPRNIWGSRHRSKILKRVFQVASFWPQICIKSIRPGPHWRSKQTPSRMVRRHPSSPPHVSSLSTPLLSRSRQIRNEVVIAPRDNGFPGLAVALDGPDNSVTVTKTEIPSTTSTVSLQL